MSNYFDVRCVIFVRKIVCENNLNFCIMYDI